MTQSTTQMDKTSKKDQQSGSNPKQF